MYCMQRLCKRMYMLCKVHLRPVGLGETPNLKRGITLSAYSLRQRHAWLITVEYRWYRSWHSAVSSGVCIDRLRVHEAQT